jgi:hypothetical protein
MKFIFSIAQRAEEGDMVELPHAAPGHQTPSRSAIYLVNCGSL